MSTNEYLDLDLDEDDATANDATFPDTFATNLSKQLSLDLQQNLTEIAQIWLQMGTPINKKDEKIGLFREAFLELSQKFYETELTDFKKQQNYREYQLNEINKILKALSLEAYVVDTSKTLLAQNKLLALKYKDLLIVKNERMEHLRLITDKLKKIYHLLGVHYQEPMFATNIPSESELTNLRTQLVNHEQQLDTRKKRYESLKSLVAKYQHELEYSPINSQEEMFLSSTCENIYSQQNIILISDFHKKIVQLYNQEKLKIEELKGVISKLFDRLEIDEAIQKSFYQSLTGSLPRIKKLLKAEIEKYEILKKSCMEKIIKNIRKNIYQLFHLCMIESSNESMLEAEDFTEELLILHETAFAKLDRFNTQYSGVFDKLREWQDSLEKLLELEKKLLDPNRLKNRGGALLLNERERKTLWKKLPKIEKEIKSLVTMIESKENLPFNSYGMNIDNFFKLNWNHFEKEKEDAKNFISKKSGCDSSKKTTYGSSQKKFRYPLSPRCNNKKMANNIISRQLFTGNSTEKAVENELEFQKHLLNQNQLQSTFMADGNIENKLCSTSQSKLINTPTSAKLQMKNMRRLSRSYDDLSKFAPKGPFGVTKRAKRPPFLP